MKQIDIAGSVVHCLGLLGKFGRILERCFMVKFYVKHLIGQVSRKT